LATRRSLVVGGTGFLGRRIAEALGHAGESEVRIEACAAQLGVTPRYARVAEDCPPGYLLPVAGRPFGHVLLDCSAIRYELGFEPSPPSVWLADALRGCAADPPEQPSAGYERRSDEVRIARAILNAPQAEV
jgi:hypothetical protein